MMITPLKKVYQDTNDMLQDRDGVYDSNEFGEKINEIIDFINQLESEEEMKPTAQLVAEGEGKTIPTKDEVRETLNNYMKQKPTTEKCKDCGCVSEGLIAHYKGCNTLPKYSIKNQQSTLESIPVRQPTTPEVENKRVIKRLRMLQRSWKELNMKWFEVQPEVEQFIYKAILEAEARGEKRGYILGVKVGLDDSNPIKI